MGIGKMLSGIGRKVFEENESETGDKHLDHLRELERKRRQEIEKKILRSRLKKDNERKFKNYCKTTMVSGKYKRKNFKMKLI